jgi:hypothetical protein
MLVDIPMPHFPQTAPLTTRLNIAVARALANIPEPPNGSIPVDVNGKIFGAEDYNRLATDAANDLLPVGGAYGWLIVAANSLEQIGSMDPIYGSRHHSLNALGRALAAIHEELEKMK